MQLLLVLLQVLGLLAAAIVSRGLMSLLLRYVRRNARHEPHPLESPLVSAVVFGVLFVAVWLLLSAVALLAWFVVWPR